MRRNGRLGLKAYLKAHDLCSDGNLALELGRETWIDEPIGPTLSRSPLRPAGHERARRPVALRRSPTASVHVRLHETKMTRRNDTFRAMFGAGVRISSYGMRRVLIRWY